MIQAAEKPPVAGLPVAEPPVLYAGPVVHFRHQPHRRLFKYRLWMLAIDLDDMDRLAKRSRLFRHNSAGLISVHDHDHGPRDGTALRPWVEKALASNDLSSFSARLRFIAMPRVFGYAFNPISFYFCYDQDNQLGAVLYQVRNTFGDQIGYLIPAQAGRSPIRQSVAKQMHVSPFFDMQGGYDFMTDLLPETFNAAIAYRTNTRRLTVKMRLTGSPFSSQALLKLLMAIPLSTLKVIIAIHWQALLLFLSGSKFYGDPKLHHDRIVKGSIS
jgi:DUF1365 family protein